MGNVQGRVKAGRREGCLPHEAVNSCRRLYTSSAFLPPTASWLGLCLTWPRPLARAWPPVCSPALTRASKLLAVRGRSEWARATAAPLEAWADEAPAGLRGAEPGAPTSEVKAPAS